MKQHEKDYIQSQLDDYRRQASIYCTVYERSHDPISLYKSQVFDIKADALAALMVDFEVQGYFRGLR